MMLSSLLSLVLLISLWLNLSESALQCVVVHPCRWYRTKSSLRAWMVPFSSFSPQSLAELLAPGRCLINIAENEEKEAWGTEPQYNKKNFETKTKKGIKTAGGEGRKNLHTGVSSSRKASHWAHLVPRSAATSFPQFPQCYFSLPHSGVRIS